MKFVRFDLFIYFLVIKLLGYEKMIYLLRKDVIRTKRIIDLNVIRILMGLGMLKENQQYKWKRGPKILPWGTPAETVEKPEISAIKITL